MRPVYLKRLLHSSLLYPSTASHRLQTRYICSAMAQTPIQTLQAAWKRIAPLELADNSWDNVGTMIEAPYPKPSAKTVMLTIDLTTEVCEEALANEDVSLLVAYHPPIFRGLKKLTLSNTQEASLLKLSAKGISVFSPHTSLDSVEGGINDFMARAFDDQLDTCEPIEPKFAGSAKVPEALTEFSDAGMGRMLKLKTGMTLEEAVRRVKALLGLKHVQVARPSTPKQIETIAVCAGSGSGLFKGVEADLYFTGEMSHHEVLALAQNGKSVILCHHSNTERPYLRAVLQEKLEKELENDWQVIVSETDRDPLETV